MKRNKKPLLNKLFLDDNKLIYIKKTEIESLPILISNPHSGRKYPDGLKQSTNISLNELRMLEDAFVDKIIDGIEKKGFVIIGSDYPRFLLDLNREVNEIDESLFYNSIPKKINKTKNVAVGHGLIFSKTQKNESIYNTKLDWLEFEKIIEDNYLIYHSSIEKIINEMLINYKTAYLIDMHSMPSSVYTNKNNMCDICIGTNFGKSCSEDFKDFLVKTFRDLGFSVGIDSPYSGGYITKKYSNKSLSIETVQIEINRKIYLDEKNLILSNNFCSFKKSIEIFFNLLKIYINNSNLKKQNIA